MASWLLFYSVGCVPVMFAVSCIAFTKRASHQMGRRHIALMSFSAGLLWPLLAIAGMQAVALLILKTALGLVRGGSSAVERVETPAVASLPPMTAAAA